MGAHHHEIYQRRRIITHPPVTRMEFLAYIHSSFPGFEVDLHLIYQTPVITGFGKIPVITHLWHRHDGKRQNALRVFVGVPRIHIGQTFVMPQDVSNL
jgi:hypothetical protein